MNDSGKEGRKVRKKEGRKEASKANEEELT